MNDKTAEKPAERKFIYQVREDWLALRQEEPIDKSLPIIDPHHHLWDRGSRYLLEELKRDIDSCGHNVRATVYLQCGSMYRAEGDAKFAPVGETEFVNGVAAMSASDLYGPARLCVGIVGFADLLLGAEVDDVLEAHLRAAGERFKGVRYSSVWDADPSIRSTQVKYPQGLLLDAKFRTGFARLSRHGLSFDSWNYHTQIAELTDLARIFPETTIVLDHIGAPLGVGAAYAGRRDEVFAHWRQSIRDLAQCPNVCVKLGGMGMRIFGFGFEDQPQPPSSADLANAWRPYVETCIEAFGPRRAMFESNFPVDKVYCSYGILWNAFKKLTAAYSADEKAELFFNTAKRTYRLPTTA
ncbi:MAG TPA: amidohydrolase family protein [Xanthobacteraceae bacterium]|nr:amidohydrolase family protein [Xanthobacteraceae bacterium]